MNLHQQREESRRRRLVNRSVAQHRQLYFDDVRRSMVLPAAPLRLQPSETSQLDQSGIDQSLMTLLLKTTIVGSMLGMLFQFHEPLTAVLTSWLPAAVRFG